MPEVPAQQQVQAGERQFGLGLDAHPAQHRDVGAALRGVVEQRALTDPGLAADHQDAAAPVARVGEQPVDRGALALAPVQHRRPPVRPVA